MNFTSMVVLAVIVVLLIIAIRNKWGILTQFELGI
jgi:hypothetical protein